MSRVLAGIERGPRIWERVGNVSGAADKKKRLRSASGGGAPRLGIKRLEGGLCR